MNRRSFLNKTGASSVSVAVAAGCSQDTQQTGSQVSGKTVITALVGKPLEELRDLYRYDLFEEFLPFMDKYVIDHEIGGFMCNTDRDGTRINTNKGTWNEGRGIWVYSFLYNKIDSNPRWLEVARKSVDFILRTKPASDNLWTTSCTREGKALGEPDTLIYSDLFVANGLQEFGKTPGNDRYWDMAKDIVIKCVNIYDNRLDYASLKPTDTSPGVSRPRIYSHWFQLGRLALQMLEKRSDPQIEGVRDRCIDAIMEHHYNPQFRLNTEYLNHDLSFIDSDYGQMITNHAQETLWLVMNEAIRRKDKQLFDTAAERFKRHVEVLWDDVYGGLFTLRHADNNTWNTSKPLWLQVEVLFGTMALIEETGDEWAQKWFSRMYEYVREKFYLKQYGLPLWNFYGDRKVTFQRHTNRVGIFQQPRHLMLNLLALDRLIERDGKVRSSFD